MKDIEKREYGVTYDDLIESMDVERLVEVTDQNYQGDTRLLLKKGDRYGYLCFGWGSCSGCDALEAIDGYKYTGNGYEYLVTAEHYELRDQLYNQIVWKDSREEMLAYFKEKDWSLDYQYDKKFVDESIQHLEGAPKL